MAILVTLDQAKAHLNVTTTDDDTLITGQIAAAQDYLEEQLGYKITGLPAPSLKQAVLMLVGHYYANREATLVGVSASELPLGVCDIINNNRNWSWADE